MAANVKTIVVCPLTLKVLRMHMLVSSNELFGLSLKMLLPVLRCDMSTLFC